MLLCVIKAPTITIGKRYNGYRTTPRTIVNDSLLFSSEFKALRAHEGHVPQIDSLAMKARLAWEYPLDGTSLLKGVCQVRPGTVEIWSMESGKPELIDTAMFEHVSLTPQAGWSGPEELLETFVTSVQQRLMSDVPVGIVLSGGLEKFVQPLLKRPLKEHNQFQSVGS